MIITGIMRNHVDFLVARNVRLATEDLVFETAAKDVKSSQAEKALQLVLDVKEGRQPSDTDLHELQAELTDFIQRQHAATEAEANVNALNQLDKTRVGDAYILQILTGVVRTTIQKRDLHTLTAQLSFNPSYAPSKVFETAADLQFDSFALNAATDCRPLSELALHIFQSEGLVAIAYIHLGKLKTFLRKIEDGYRHVPYHNRIHACDVLQRVYAIVQTVAADVFSADEKISCYLAAIIHDFEHAGVSNTFLIASKHKLARRYNDKSVWENHHVSAAWDVLTQEECDFLCNMSSAQIAAIRQNVITLVRATDLVKHMKWMKRYAASASPIGRYASHDTKLLAICLALKAADVGHTTSAYPVHKKWLSALQDELHAQGDLERKIGIPNSPMTDRHSDSDISSSQVGFFDVIVLPLYTQLTAYYTGTQPMLQAAQDNRDANRFLLNHP